MNLRHARCAATVIALLVLTMDARAESAVVAGQAYARGVEAFFSGRSADAERQLLDATGDDANDPRPHYFRGLTLLRQGRSEEGRGELMLGSELEARSPGHYPVGKSLERVQGSDRLLLENYRREARLQRDDIRGGRLRLRAEQDAHRDATGQRSRISIPLEQLNGPSALEQGMPESDGTATSSAAQSIDATSSDQSSRQNSESLADPFVDDPQPPSPAATAAAHDDDPFAVDGSPPPTEPSGKVSSGKLFGILGRVMKRSAEANLPPLAELRDAIPFPGAAPADPATDDSDAFAQPFSPEAAPREVANPDAAADLVPPEFDPFGEVPAQP